MSFWQILNLGGNPSRTRFEFPSLVTGPGPTAVIQSVPSTCRTHREGGIANIPFQNIFGEAKGVFQWEKLMGRGWPTVVVVALGLRLVRAREEAGLTQVEVANRLGVSQSFVSKSERGNRRLLEVDFHDFSELYDKTVGELAGPPTEDELRRARAEIQRRSDMEVARRWK